MCFLVDTETTCQVKVGLRQFAFVVISESHVVGRIMRRRIILYETDAKSCQLKLGLGYLQLCYCY